MITYAFIIVAMISILIVYLHEKKLDKDLSNKLNRENINQLEQLKQVLTNPDEIKKINNQIDKIKDSLK